MSEKVGRKNEEIPVIVAGVHGRYLVGRPFGGDLFGRGALGRGSFGGKPSGGKPSGGKPFGGGSFGRGRLEGCPVGRYGARIGAMVDDYFDFTKQTVPRILKAHQ